MRSRTKGKKRRCRFNTTTNALLFCDRRGWNVPSTPSPRAVPHSAAAEGFQSCCQSGLYSSIPKNKRKFAPQAFCFARQNICQPNKINIDSHSEISKGEASLLLTVSRFDPKSSGGQSFNRWTPLLRICQCMSAH